MLDPAEVREHYPMESAAANPENPTTVPMTASASCLRTWTVNSDDVHASGPPIHPSSRPPTLRTGQVADTRRSKRDDCGWALSGRFRAQTSGREFMI